MKKKIAKSLLASSMVLGCAVPMQDYMMRNVMAYKQVENVIEINANANWIDLQNAITNAKDGDIIKIVGEGNKVITNANVNDCLTLSDNKNITLDLNGWTYEKTSFPSENDFNNQIGLVNVKKGCLTIINGTLKVSNNVNTNYSYAVAATEEGHFILGENGKIEIVGKNNAGAAARVDGSNATVEVNGGVVDATLAGQSTELFETKNGGDIVLKDGVFKAASLNICWALSNSSSSDYFLTGGKYHVNPETLIQEKTQYKVITSDDSNAPYEIIRVQPTLGVWKANYNHIESSSLYVYNPQLATSTNLNPKVIELNGKLADNNYVYRTISNLAVGTKYSYNFDYTNRVSASPSEAENTFTVYAVPGTNNTNLETAKTEKIGTYFGYDNAWTTANGEFVATAETMTFVFKPKKSTGLGGIIDPAKFNINLGYKLNAENASSTNNVLKNGNFEDTNNGDWRTNGDTNGEIRDYSVYTPLANLNKTNVLEVTGPDFNGEKNAVVYQKIDGISVGSKVEYSFDFTNRTTGTPEFKNIISVYFVPGEDVDNYTKGVKVGTILGANGYWQTTSATFTVPKMFENVTSGYLVFEGSDEGSGGIVDNVYVNVESFDPVIEKVTDTTITVSNVDGATYKLLDEKGNVLRENNGSNVFNDLDSGTAYRVVVVKGEQSKTIDAITTKKTPEPAIPAEVTKVTETTITINTVEGQKYSIGEIDGETEWVVGTGTPITFEGLEPGKKYNINTFNGETFTTIEETTIKKTENVATIDFIKEYLSDSKNNVYEKVTKDNYFKVLEAEKVWNELPQFEKTDINERLKEKGSQSFEGLLKDAQVVEAQVAEETRLNELSDKFIKDYVSKDTVIYKEATKDNYKQILSGEETWNGYTDAEKAAINAKLKANGGKTYEELLAQAKEVEKQVAEEARLDALSDKFIEKYVSNDDGEIYKEATLSNYAQILSGKETWNGYTDAEKDAINAKLKANGGKTYEELLKLAEAIDKEVQEENRVQNVAIEFIQEHLMDDKGNIYKKATQDNYKDILGGEEDWKAMSQAEKDAVNAILKANGGKTYEELLKLAKKLDQSESADTSDHMHTTTYLSAMFMSMLGAVALFFERKNQENSLIR